MCDVASYGLHARTSVFGSAVRSDSLDYNILTITQISVVARSECSEERDDNNIRVGIYYILLCIIIIIILSLKTFFFLLLFSRSHCGPGRGCAATAYTSI